MLVKAIFRVNLQFGSPRGYEQAMKMYDHKVEQLYKGEVCIKPEMMAFDDVNLSMSIPNLVVTTLEKTIKNTAFLLENIAQYAIAGKGYVWILDNGKATFSCYIEPTESKTLIQSFLKGRQLAKEAGHESEAIEVLSDVIAKFGRHWTALERRGYVHGLVGNFEQATADFDASIAVNEHQADAYFSRARVKMLQGKKEEAIPDFDITWKNANPQLPIYWSARRVKAECCMELGRYAEAAQELKFFTKQNFTVENSNYPWRKDAWLNYSYSLAQVDGLEKEAREAFLTVNQIEDGLEPIMDDKMTAFYNKMTTMIATEKPSKKNKKIIA
jgi:tetratricopeptide (TPR) repeat protein